MKQVTRPSKKRYCPQIYADDEGRKEGTCVTGEIFFRPSECRDELAVALRKAGVCIPSGFILKTALRISRQARKARQEEEWKAFGLSQNLHLRGERLIAHKLCAWRALHCYPSYSHSSARIFSHGATHLHRAKRIFRQSAKTCERRKRTRAKDAKDAKADQTTILSSSWRAWRPLREPFGCGSAALSPLRETQSRI